MKALDLNACSREVLNKVLFLLKTDTIFVSSFNPETNSYDEGTYPVILCNDIFGPGSDAEPLEEKDIDLYTLAVNKHGWQGATAFVGLKRGKNPWQDDKGEWMKAYYVAVEDLKSMGVTNV